MKKRNPMAVFGLSIITLGIYDIYWLAKTRKELNKESSTKVPSVWLLFVPLLIFVISLIAFMIIAIGDTPTTHTVVSTFNNQTTTSTVQTTNGSTNKLGLLFLGIYILDGIITFFISFYWFFKFSKSVNEYTNGKMGTGVTFLLLWVLHLIGVAVVQDTFNDMIDSGQVPGTPPPGVPAPTPAGAGVVTGGAVIAGQPGQPPLVTPATAAPVAPIEPAVPSADAATVQPLAQPQVQPEASVVTPAPMVITPEVPAAPVAEVPAVPAEPSSDPASPSSPTVQS
jgi:hypothetical protein